MKKAINLSVNGVSHTDEVEPRMLLVHYLRDVLSLTGTHVGCDTSQCGACTIIMDGAGVDWGTGLDLTGAAPLEISSLPPPDAFAFSRLLHPAPASGTPPAPRLGSAPSQCGACAIHD